MDGGSGDPPQSPMNTPTGLRRRGGDVLSRQHNGRHPYQWHIRSTGDSRGRVRPQPAPSSLFRTEGAGSVMSAFHAALGIAGRMSGVTGEPLTLTNIEKVRASIELGESHFREFKSAFSGPPGSKVPRDPAAIRKDIGEALVAFANADGGEVFIGVEDDGEITGIPHKPEVIETFFTASTTNVLPSTPLAAWKGRAEIDGQLVLTLGVEKSLQHIHQTSDGKCLQRRDRETIPISSGELHLERAERVSREYDRTFVPGAMISDLKADLLGELVHRLGGRLSPEKALQLVELAEYSIGQVKLRRAALLLFAAEIHRWHPRCEVRLLRIHGAEMQAVPEYNVEELETVSGPIISLLPEAWDALRPHLSRTIYASGVFESRITYPDDACFEALVNAIAHRDYSQEGRPIEVLIFDDRVEFRSPGGLLSGVTIAGLSELRGLHQSRNAFVARGLRELGLMREMGEGMRRIFSLVRQRDLIDPELQAEPESFSISLFHRSVYSPAAQRWLSGYERFNLSPEERKVILLGRDGNIFSPNDIMTAVGLVDTDDYRAIVESLQLEALLTTSMTKSQISNIALKERRSARGGISRARRNVARYGVRDADEAEGYLAEVTRAVRRLGTRKALSADNLRTIGASLSPTNPIKSLPIQRSLTALGIIDEQRRPIVT